MQLRFSIIFAWAFLVLVLFTAGCRPDTPAVASPVAPVTFSPTVTSLDPTETPPPTVTQDVIDENTSLSEVILLSPPDANPDLADSMESTLSELASQEGFDFERLDSLDPADLGSETRLVAALAPDPGLVNLAASAPQVQFLSIDIPGITAGGNLSTLAASAPPGEQVGFLAGYLAALVTPEWRVGVIAPSDTSAGVSARQGFLNGVVFFCGLCRQTYPPYVTYPVYAELPSTASPAEWQAAGQTLVDQSVQTVYLAPGADGEELIAFLGQAGLEIIASGQPPAGLKDQWVASLQTDTVGALQEAWPSLLAGEGGRALSIPLVANNTNEEILTPGRMRLLDEMAANLETGFIDPSIKPAGEEFTP